MMRLELLKLKISYEKYKKDLFVKKNLLETILL